MTRRNVVAWVVVRDAVLERDGFNCQATEYGLQHVCRGGLHVHHILRRSQGGQDEPDNLVTLCSEAHSIVHANPTCSYEQGLLRRSGM